ncbi:component of the polarisome [Chytridiales sp. JEL 0842]|nr:component of the polarisome [Chytridiales sp. JEL 0842]
MSSSASDSIAVQQYESLRLYLDSFLQSQKMAGNSSQQRANAKDKLAKLSKQQFIDLSTDVYDEMNRRQMQSNEVPFLPVRDDLHPKRNQARQKLATLPSSRFKELACDVFFEIERRFPIALQQYNAKYGIQDDYNQGQEPRSPALSNGARSPAYNNEGNASLDNLMTDIGNMMPYQKGPNGDQINGIPPESVDRMRNEYESRIESLQSRIIQLEKDARNYQSEQTARLEEKLSTQIKINKDLELALEQRDRDYRKLQEDYNGLQDDYNNQQQVKIAEATNLLEEIKSLQRKNEELMAERGGSAYRDDGNAYQQHTYLSQSPDVAGGLLNMEDTGIIDRSRVLAYQDAVDDLLRSARSETPTSVLVAMKAIVIACKNITEDTEAYESASKSLQDEDKERLEDVKNKLSSSLTNLMAAAKNHATSYGSSPVSLLEGAATNLTATIVELVKLLKIKENNAYNDGDRRDEWDNDQDGYDIDELKGFLEKQTDLIVQAIQGLLHAMRQSTSFGQEFTDTVRGITSIVDNLVKVASRTLSKPSGVEFRNRGEAILQELESANIRLEELGVSMINSPQSKTLKQKLASSSYEIAKHVKELISLIAQPANPTEHEQRMSSIGTPASTKAKEVALIAACRAPIQKIVTMDGDGDKTNKKNEGDKAKPKVPPAKKLGSLKASTEASTTSNKAPARMSAQAGSSATKPKFKPVKDVQPTKPKKTNDQREEQPPKMYNTRKEREFKPRQPRQPKARIEDTMAPAGLFALGPAQREKASGGSGGSGGGRAIASVTSKQFLSKEELNATPGVSDDEDMDDEFGVKPLAPVALGKSSQRARGHQKQGAEQQRLKIKAEEESDEIIADDDHLMKTSMDTDFEMDGFPEPRPYQHDLYFFQFPALLPELTSAAEKVEDSGNQSLPANGYVGKLLVRKSGKMTVQIGSIEFEASVAPPGETFQNVVSVSNTQKNAVVVGPVTHKFVCTPDIDDLLKTTSL